MKRAVLIAGALAALAVLGRRAARQAPPAASFSGGARVRELREILASRGDNDPRLDRDFGALTPAEKAEFRAEYRRLPPERRNERGTIVYLLGKNLSAHEDWAFLSEAASEPRCLSLADCASSGAGAIGDDVTLAYPALVAVKQAERAMAGGKPAPEAEAVLRAARTSKAPAVQRLLDRLGRKP